MMSIVAIGFLTYLIIRHISSAKVFEQSASQCHCCWVLGVGVNMIYSSLYLPSDVVAGYEFGALWLTAMVIMLEVFRDDIGLFNKSSAD